MIEDHGQAMLRVEHIRTFYGRSQVLESVSLALEEGEIVSLLGRQGSGKTTILKAIMGIIPISSGRIEFCGEDITGRPPYEICRTGIGYVPQNKEIFPSLTVEQNLKVVGGGARGLGWDIGQVYDIFTDLKAIKDRYGLNLSGGERQLLAIARGLMVNPQLILLDEPSIGLSPGVLARIESLLKEISTQGVSILMAEQNVRFATSLANRGYLIDRGRIQEDLEKWEALKDRPDLPVWEHL
ncbi:MAG: ATP-binding cassette domain-containing protein [Proteobacteria bacterium]|nr:ATP-binding cassette domain-containing protein [Pseudomonadota bacterium]